jgi:anti-sigma factor ChrR (cupin superfamily)
MLTCREISELATDYMEGELSLVRRLSFSFHLFMCHVCREYVDQLKRTVKLLGKLPAAEAANDHTDKALSAFKSWRSD